MLAKLKNSHNGILGLLSILYHKYLIESTNSFKKAKKSLQLNKDLKPSSKSLFFIPN